MVNVMLRGYGVKPLAQRCDSIHCKTHCVTNKVVSKWDIEE